MNKHRTPKYMKVADVRDPSFEHLIGSLIVSFHNDGPILSIARCFDCLSPKVFWKDCAIQHCPCSLNECHVLPFSYSILFKSIRRREVLRYTFSSQKHSRSWFLNSVPLSVLIFHLDIILIFNIPDKGHDCISCLTLFGQEVNPSVSWVFIHNNQSILLMVNGHRTDMSKQIHVKEMKAAFDWKWLFGFEWCPMVFSFFTSRTRLVFGIHQGWKAKNLVLFGQVVDTFEIEMRESPMPEPVDCLTCLREEASPILSKGWNV